MGRLFIIIAGISGFLSAAAGAFAAHALKTILAQESMLVLQTAIQYQLFHALALLAIGTLIQLQPQRPLLKGSGWNFIVGSLLFSGSLYGLALDGPRWLGFLTPLGGTCFLIGWLLLICGVWRVQR